MSMGRAGAGETPQRVIPNTFRVSTHCHELRRLTSPEMLDALDFDPQRDLVLGDGSNVLLVDDIPGRVILNRIAGLDIVESDADHAVVLAGAGEDWHRLVRWSVEQGLGGLENLSLIPGRVGAAPIQNIGAYGVELADTLVAVHAWDWHARTQRRLEADECGFAYRDSRFKSTEPGRFLITGLELRLDRNFRPRLAYAGIADELASAGIETPSPRDVSDAVVRLRQRKLPDPAQIGNAGSFFKNPVVDAAAGKRLTIGWPALPLHAVDQNRYKASAAWMIEHCGWKGRRIGDAGVSEQHALVLVNHGQASGQDILDLAQRVQHAVEAAFGIALEPEPRIIRF